MAVCVLNFFRYARRCGLLGSRHVIGKITPVPGSNGRVARARFVEVDMPAVASGLVIEVDGGGRILLSDPAPAANLTARMGGADARWMCGP